MLETITNYPKLARVNIVFKIEVAYLALQTIGMLIALGYIITQISRLNQFLDEQHASRVDHWAIIGICFLLSLCYFAEMFLAVILYKGIQAKDFKKLAFWAICTAVLCICYGISAILDVIEKQFVGSTSYITTLIVVVYRSIAIKIVYDAIQELRKFPLTVPFVNMRDCEDRV